MVHALLGHEADAEMTYQQFRQRYIHVYILLQLHTKSAKMSLQISWLAFRKNKIKSGR